MSNVQPIAPAQPEEEARLFPDLGSPRNQGTPGIRIRFTNFCDFDVDLFWLNQDKKACKYATLGNKQYIDMRTYENHPWIARRKFDGMKTLLDGQFVFLPKPVPPQVIVTKMCLIKPKQQNLQERAMRAIVKDFKMWQPHMHLLPVHLKTEVERIRATLIEYRDYICRSYTPGVIPAIPRFNETERFRELQRIENERRARQN